MSLNNDVLHSIWVFVGGSILVLLQSILSGAKRNWWSLAIGCIFGGAGSWIASQIWGDSKYVFVICGVAAVVTENLLLGVVNASKEFAENPLKVGTAFLKTFVPFFGKNIGDSGISTSDLK